MAKRDVLCAIACLVLWSCVYGADAHAYYDQGGLDWEENCLSGKKQSPIDILTGNIRSMTARPTYRFVYQGITALIIRNRGHTEIFIMSVPAGNTVTITSGSPAVSVVYDLISFSCHAPSEHTVNGLYYPFECQFTHTSRVNPNNIVMFSVLYRLSPNRRDNAWINQWLNDIPTNFTTGYNINNITVNMNIANQLRNSPFRKTSTAWRYLGSLPYPKSLADGCIETVEWFVMAPNITQTISPQQLTTFQNMVAMSSKGVRANNRPTQPLNNRVVQSVSFNF